LTTHEALEALFDKWWDRVTNGPMAPRTMVATMIDEARAILAKAEEPRGDAIEKKNEK
jgi:hypothetical protein